MRMLVFAVPALLFAGAAAAQEAVRGNPLDPQAKVPPVAFRSAFEGYQAFVEQERRNWRDANQAVGVAGGHAGMMAGQGTGEHSSKPQPGKPETSGGAAEKDQGAPSHGDHHK